MLHGLKFSPSNQTTPEYALTDGAPGRRRGGAASRQGRVRARASGPAVARRGGAASWRGRLRGRGRRAAGGVCGRGRSLAAEDGARAAGGSGPTHRRAPCHDALGCGACPATMPPRPVVHGRPRRAGADHAPPRRRPAPTPSRRGPCRAPPLLGQIFRLIFLVSELIRKIEENRYMHGDACRLRIRKCRPHCICSAPCTSA